MTSPWMKSERHRQTLECEDDPRQMRLHGRRGSKQHDSTWGIERIRGRLSRGCRLTVSSKELVFSSVGMGHEARKAIDIFNYTDSEWGSLSVEPSAEWLTAKTEQVKPVPKPESAVRQVWRSWPHSRRSSCRYDCRRLDPHRLLCQTVAKETARTTFRALIRRRETPAQQRTPCRGDQDAEPPPWEFRRIQEVQSR